MSGRCAGCTVSQLDTNPHLGLISTHSTGAAGLLLLLVPLLAGKSVASGSSHAAPAGSGWAPAIAQSAASSAGGASTRRAGRRCDKPNTGANTRSTYRSSQSVAPLGSPSTGSQTLRSSWAAGPAGGADGRALRTRSTRPTCATGVGGRAVAVRDHAAPPRPLHPDPAHQVLEGGAAIPKHQVGPALALELPLVGRPQLDRCCSAPHQSPQ